MYVLKNNLLEINVRYNSKNEIVTECKNNSNYLNGLFVLNVSYLSLIVKILQFLNVESL